ncbi:MAG: hypothetical protein M9947_03480 [Thermomicrobiales bacterium]|nr:hypothetical protein [Thermomicrobiales bacterium]
MRHARLLLLLAIAVLAGFTSRTMFDAAPLARESTTDTPNTETARAFYTALNAALDGASPEPLEHLLSSIFVDRHSEGGTSRTGTEFLDEVRALGASLQRIRLEVISLDAVGDTLIVGIRPVVLGPIEVAALRIEPPAPAPRYEVIRVARGKLIDRWSSGLPGLGLSMMIDGPVRISSTTGIAATLRRIELAGPSEAEWHSTGAGILLVESGSVVVQTTLRNDLGPATIVASGGFVAIDPGMRVRLWTAAGSAASALLYTADRIAAVDHAPVMGGVNAIAQDAPVTLLWNGLWHDPRPGTEHRAVQIALHAGETLDLQQPAGSAVLVVVDRGVLQMAIPNGTVSKLDANRWPEAVAGSAQIEANCAGLVQGSGLVTLRNLTSEPLSLTLISVSG